MFLRGNSQSVTMYHLSQKKVPSAPLNMVYHMSQTDLWFQGFLYVFSGIFQ